MKAAPIWLQDAFGTAQFWNNEGLYKIIDDETFPVRVLQWAIQNNIEPFVKAYEEVVGE
jgi:hypothetical protein